MNGLIDPPINDCPISPTGDAWNSFFMSTQRASDDFMNERRSQEEIPRETIE